MDPKLHDRVDDEGEDKNGEGEQKQKIVAESAVEEGRNRSIRGGNKGDREGDHGVYRDGLKWRSGQCRIVPVHQINKGTCGSSQTEAEIIICSR